MKKLLALLLSAVLAVTVFAGCGQKSEPSPSPSASQPTKQAEPKKDELKGTITTIHYMSQKSKTEGWAELEKKFTERNPGVKFDNTEIVQTNYFSSLRSKVAANDAPDVIMGQPSQYPDIIKTGMILDLTNNPALKKLDLEKGDLNDSSYDGKIYAFPFDFKTYGVFYNVEIFNKLGLKPPKNQKELMAICETLKKNGIDPWARSYKDQVFPDIEIRGILWPLLQQNGKFDAFEKLMNGTTKFKDYPEFKTAMNLWTERLKYDRIDDLGNDQNKSIDLFVSGKTGMIYTGTWNVGEIFSKNPNMKVDIFPLPMEDKEGIFCAQVDELFMVSKGKDNGELAIKFMEFCLTPEMAALWTDKTLMPSVVKGVPTDKLPPLLGSVMKAKSAGTMAHAGKWTAQMYGEFTVKWRAMLQKYATDKKWDVDKFTDELQATWDEVVKTTKK